MYQKLTFYTLLIGLLIPVSLHAQSDSSATNESTRARAEYIRGLEEFENENYEQALEHLTRAYSDLSGNAGVNFALSDAYLAMNDLSNAAFYGKKAADLEPQNKWYHLKLAQIYRRSGRNQATIDELNKALEYHPNATDVLAQLASVYSSHQEFLRSNEIYDRLLELSGPDIGIYLQKLQNFNELNMRDSSVVQLQKIRALDPDNISTLRMMSNYYLEMDQTGQAKNVLKDALLKNSRDPQTLVMLADIYVEEAQWDSVETMLSGVVSDTLIERRAKLDVAQFLFSRYQQDVDNTPLKSALESLLQQFVETEPDYGAAHALAADYYLNESNNTRAIEALERTNELNPNNDMAWRQRLQLMLGEGNYNEVIEEGEKANEFVPQDPFILYFVGNAYLATSRPQQALEWFQEASDTPSRRPFKSTIFGSMGDAYSALDQWNRAVDAYEQALSLNPQNHNVLNNYSYYLSVREERLDEAEQMALRAIGLSSGNSSYLDTVGWVFYKKEEYEKARDYIQQSIDTGDASAEVFEHMGDVMEQLGNLQQAQRWWEEALQKDPSRSHLKEKLLQ